MIMEGRAVVRYLKISPQKLRLIADEIRGFPYREAQALLKYMNKKGAQLMLNLLNSAYANLIDKKKIKDDSVVDERRVFIKTLIVDQGPITKRWMPRARGRSTRILKRASNATLILMEEE